ncbi:hypothetical protein RRG08_056659 [Elysia crispata]|uniref:Uncharacterized protein n=1 Tax=Elysia crispata TaxID=231223 RepID=A0AAE1CYU2_9GAST|nr:hypothetical protein RRG08_056659 [Elysia crispata]
MNDKLVPKDHCARAAKVLYGSMDDRHQKERESELRWPSFKGIPFGPADHLDIGQFSPLPPTEVQPPVCPDSTTRHDQDYQFRYDDGLSSRLGVRRIPLVLTQPDQAGRFSFQPAVNPLEKPLRTERQRQQPYWTPVTRPDGPEARPDAHWQRNIGLFCDPTRCPPSETVLKNF